MKNFGTENIKFIYWFAYYNIDSPSVRYRGKYPLDYLKSKYRVNSYFVVPGYSLNNVMRFLRAYFSALFFRKKNSMIVIQRIHSGFIYATMLKFLIKVRREKTFYDLDDADYLDYPPKSIFYFLRNCSVSFLGSRELMQNLSSYSPNLLLNPSPTPDLKIFKKKKNNLLTIGWIGDFDGGHRESMLNDFFPALKNLNFNFRLVLLGVGRKSDTDFSYLTNYFSNMPNITLEMPADIDWNNEKKIQQRISGFDIGIATLLDNELQRSKSAFKLKQYLTCGIPVLSTNLPENKYYVSHGKNGYVCTTPGEFAERIIEFYEMNDNEYMKFSKCARESARDFSLEKYRQILLAGRITVNERTQDRSARTGKRGVLYPDLALENSHTA
jgi:glycosyltransferase involved in cell wall biosynthesis